MTTDPANLRDLHAYVRMLAASGRLIRALDPPISQSSSPPLPPTSPPSTDPSEILAQIARDACACQACPLGQSRTQAVPGTGNPRARLLLVGEAPGAQEDAQGEPFVGRAGQLLTLALSEAGMARSEVFIANVLKCRPPGNRDPEPEEIAACRPLLHRQIDAINPIYVAALGRIAAGMLLGRTVAIMRERGTWASYHGKPLFLSLHPSAVLHNPNNRSLFLQDIKDLVNRVREKEQGSSQAGSGVQMGASEAKPEH